MYWVPVYLLSTSGAGLPWVSVWWIQEEGRGQPAAHFGYLSGMLTREFVI